VPCAYNPTSPAAIHRDSGETPRRIEQRGSAVSSTDGALGSKNSPKLGGLTTRLAWDPFLAFTAPARWTARVADRLRRQRARDVRAGLA
jgi:hypothetical protein